MRFSEFMREKVSLILAAWGVFAVVSYILLWQIGNGEEWASDATYLPYDGSVVIAFFVLLYVVKFYGTKSFEGKVWVVITVGVGLWMVAELIHGFNVLLEDAGVGSVPAFIHDNTDYPFLAGYVVIAAGFFYKMRFTKLYKDYRKASIITTFVVIFAVVSTFVATLPTLASTDYSDSDKFFTIAYVAMDILLFSTSLTVALFWGADVSKGWYILAAGLLLMMIADVTVTALDLQGIYFDGALIELSWVGAYLFIGLAANYQKKLHSSFI